MQSKLPSLLEPTYVLFYSIDNNNIGSNGCKILAKAGMQSIQHLGLGILINILKNSAKLGMKQ